MPLVEVSDQAIPMCFGCRLTGDGYAAKDANGGGHDVVPTAVSRLKSP